MVGDGVAKICHPKTISKDKKTLVLEVKPQFLLIVQYQTETILKRVHEYLDDSSIQRIKIRKEKSIAPEIKKNQKTNNIFTNLVLDIEDEGVRDALTKLGKTMK